MIVLKLQCIKVTVMIQNSEKSFFDYIPFAHCAPVRSKHFTLKSVTLNDTKTQIKHEF